MAAPSILPKKQQNKRTERPAPTEEQVRKRAYEIYLQRGEQPGSEEEDWLQAEAELLWWNQSDPDFRLARLACFL
ncbi:MAG: DUF2934 domain-containing protein [Ignavibacteriota bacterium]